MEIIIRDAITINLRLFKVNLEFNFSIPGAGLFQTWNSNKPGFEKLNIRSEHGFEKLNSRSELVLNLRFTSFRQSSVRNQPKQFFSYY